MKKILIAILLITTYGTATAKNQNWVNIGKEVASNGEIEIIFEVTPLATFPNRNVCIKSEKRLKYPRFIIDGKEAGYSSNEGYSFCYDFWMANALAKGNELVIKQGKSEMKHSLIGLSKALQE